MAGTPTRADDDRVLDMLARRKAGATNERIAAEFGLSRARIAQLTDAVRLADLAESGEPESRVATRYWPTRNRGARHAG